MNTSWEDAETFLAVAESRSFSAAALLLDVGQPTVSRRIAGLESRLGCQLFIRGRQGAQLTDSGVRLLPAAREMARWAAEFGRLAQGAEETPAGVVRIAAPPGLAVEVLAPLAARARHRLPEIRLEILAGIDYVDLSRGRADLAIRTRESHEPDLTTLHSAEFAIAVHATAGYRARLDERLAAEGRGAEPYRLADLDWITWSFPYESVAPRPMLERAIPGFAPVFASDDYLVLKSALAAGLGVMVLEKQGIPVTAASPEACLVEIDLGFSLPPSEYHLVCARSMAHVPRVRAIADLLVERLEEGRAS